MKKKQTKTLIFDFDGVISDTDVGRFNVLNVILSKYGIDLDEKHNKDMLSGITTDAFLLQNFHQLSPNDINNIIETRRNLYLKSLAEYCIPIHGAIDTLRKYSKATSLYLVTTNDCGIIEKLVVHLSIKNFFKRIFCRDHIEIKNSVLKNYSGVLKQINKTPKDCIVIEDSEIGIISAKKANIFTIKFGNQKISGNVDYDYSVKNFTELNKFLDNLFGYNHWLKSDRR